MKYLLILVAFAAMALVSCNDSTTNNTPAQPTVNGVWKATTPIPFQYMGSSITADLKLVLTLTHTPPSTSVTGKLSYDVVYKEQYSGIELSLNKGDISDLTGTFVNPNVNLSASGYTFPGILAGDGKSMKMKPTGLAILPAGTELNFTKQ